MEFSTHHHVPSLYIQSKGERSTNIALRLTRASNRFIIRITGGCANMEYRNAQNLCELFEDAFAYFSGAILFGGTRMLKISNPKKIIPGITEIVPRLKKTCPNSVSLGVIPRTQELKLTDHGLCVAIEPDKDCFTIVHPEQDMCVVVQISPDHVAQWDAEAQECAEIINDLRVFAQWKSLLISYNGGGVTEREIINTAKRGWPILFIEGSGRKTDEYAKNKKFLEEYPCVHVAQKNSDSIRKKLYELGAIEKPRIGLVRKDKSTA